MICELIILVFGYEFFLLILLKSFPGPFSHLFPRLFLLNWLSLLRLRISSKIFFHKHKTYISSHWLQISIFLVRLCHSKTTQGWNSYKLIYFNQHQFQSRWDNAIYIEIIRLQTSSNVFKLLCTMTKWFSWIDAVCNRFWP